jgi:hypothetical protein
MKDLNRFKSLSKQEQSMLVAAIEAEAGIVGDHWLVERNARKQETWHRTCTHSGTSLQSFRSNTHVNNGNAVDCGVATSKFLCRTKDTIMRYQGQARTRVVELTSVPENLAVCSRSSDTADWWSYPIPCSIRSLGNRVSQPHSAAPLPALQQRRCSTMQPATTAFADYTDRLSLLVGKDKGWDSS